MGSCERSVVFRTVVAFALIGFLAQAASAAQMTFYQLPRDTYPHDVAPAPDGTVWYTAQSSGFLGRFDPKSGKNEVIPLGPNSAPHGVIVGPDGAAWVTDGGQNAIARVDPATKTVKLFPLPKQFPNADLNTATFDHDGKLWFTGQSGVHGRVDPLTGAVEAWASPRPGSYGITTTPSGEVWFVALAGDYLGKIDRATGAVSVIEPPRKGVGPRRIWSDSKGMLWVSFWNSGGIGRYDPMAKHWTVYAMPNNVTSTYAVYVDDRDRVWATDWSANAIQRFDPASETFETFPSDKRAASVRQMLGRPGEAWGGESGTGRLVVIRD
jgi:virginiamycin B lyase